ncbi:SDR family NAD(P)-dependent oxidoreductase [Microbacterium oxydans]|uniref:3-oxoacyl-[acyl-carrier-protein] reductase FabG n=1 Tax=Microbacterium oxydans TaxID=82380 RepID=A0A0F0LA49_9MICO|nr:SDR family NAD(P)-dependent oxidoreductase [Microbacterium oxydans]KJL30072.1 3-oxoacyl-[acyl-carrier-protein] reductase FabG [Microbacterium oxydans]
MNLELADKKVFISGSTQGIGFAVAALCAAEGAAVVLNGRTQHGVADAVGRLRAEVPDAEVSGIAADLSDAAEVSALLETLGEVDVLVNNTGVFDVVAFEEIGDAEWTRYFETNVMGAVRLSRALLPAMLENDWGRIVFIGTESAVDVPAGMIHYGATKAAALALANGLAKLTRGTGVTVNTVLGGPTYSDGVARQVEHIAAANSMTADELKGSLIRETSLLQRFIEPDEIAHLVAYLASPLSSATNGAALRADGGVLTTIL